MSDIEKIKQLRQLTGAGFKDCNLALKESLGDLVKATEILRVKGIAKASKKMSREAKEGLILISGNENKSSILEVNCETDFVAKNEDFILFVKELSELNNKCSSDLVKLDKLEMKNQKSVNENLTSLIAKIGEKITVGRSKTLENKNSINFSYQHSIIKDNVSKLGVIVSLESNHKPEIIQNFGKQLAMHIAATSPIAITADKIEKKIIDKEQELVSEELKNSGKPDEIVKKIALGKLHKFKEENSLMTQDWVMDPKKKVKDVMMEIGDKSINIIDFVRLKIGE